MAHFARINENNVVLEVLVVNDDYLKDENGNEVEELGRIHMEKVHGGRWIQTSYNNKIRYRYAGIGCIYDETLDVFLPEKRYSSWILNEETYEWEPPISKPTNIPVGYHCNWDDSSVSWVFDGKIIYEELFRSELTVAEKLLWDNPDTASTALQKASIITFKTELPLTYGEETTTELLDLLVSEGVFTQQRLDEIIDKL